MTAPAYLVTGGAGFIGSTFVEQCAAKSVPVVVLDKLTYAGHVDNLKHVPRDRYKLVEGDIADTALVNDLLNSHRITHVVNFAAESHVDNSITGPVAFIDTNIMGSFRLLQTCLEYFKSLDGDNQSRFRFLQISTDEVYGSLGPTGKFSETSQIKPNSPYSASKAAADHLVRAWHETFGLPVITTHCTNNYGPRQHPEKLIPNMILCALSGKNLPVYGDGKNVRDWIQVEDHAAGVHLALERGKPGEVYDFGGDAEVQNIDLVQSICTLLDERKPKASGCYADQIAFVTDRLGHDRRYAIDDSKVQEELGFTRKYTLEQGLATTVDWYLAHMDWCKMMKGRS
ncbi:MAG: dTDP-glucose 4,6-dehydratase [Alphaproteobacteria bacterium]